MGIYITIYKYKNGDEIYVQLNKSEEGQITFIQNLSKRLVDILRVSYQKEIDE